MAKKSLKRGIFITFEGPEGSGKSTHSKLAVEFLRKEGFDIVYTRDPGGTALGDRIRQALLNSGNIVASPVSEMLLFEASRAVLVRQVIKPALLKKKVVICDRFTDATWVYQGYAGKVPMKDIKKVESVSLRGVKPDLTIILDIKAEEGLKKIKHWARDRMELKDISFHKKVRRGYLALARREKKRIKVIKTMDNREHTFNKVKKEVMNAIRTRTR